MQTGDGTADALAVLLDCLAERSLMRSVSRFVLRRLQNAFETGRILPYLMTTIAVVAVVFGVLMWVFDREDFPSLGLALWWATSTVTTVGYGDAVPVQPVGRVVATEIGRASCRERVYSNV